MKKHRKLIHTDLINPKPKFEHYRTIWALTLLLLGPGLILSASNTALTTATNTPYSTAAIRLYETNKTENTVTDLYSTSRTGSSWTDVGNEAKEAKTASMQQDRKEKFIKGLVTDEKGETLIGVSVVVQETKKEQSPTSMAISLSRLPRAT